MMKNKKIVPIILFLILVVVAALVFVANKLQIQTPKIESCTSDAECGREYSCWNVTPRGAFRGIRGSEEYPGVCWSNKEITQIY